VKRLPSWVDDAAEVRVAMVAFVQCFEPDMESRVPDTNAGAVRCASTNAGGLTP
jgi:hypothetical protein